MVLRSLYSLSIISASVSSEPSFSLSIRGVLLSQAILTYYDDIIYYDGHVPWFGHIPV